MERGWQAPFWVYLDRAWQSNKERESKAGYCMKTGGKYNQTQRKRRDLQAIEDFWLARGVPRPHFSAELWRSSEGYVTSWEFRKDIPRESVACIHARLIWGCSWGTSGNDIDINSTSTWLIGQSPCSPNIFWVVTSLHPLQWIWVLVFWFSPMIAPGMSACTASMLSAIDRPKWGASLFLARHNQWTLWNTKRTHD